LFSTNHFPTFAPLEKSLFILLKRLLSIFLVLLLLYNMVGFSLLYCWEEYGMPNSQEINIEESSDYYWIKQPLQLPYQVTGMRAAPLKENQTWRKPL
jgi:ABC-type antimicrobial peptide transport system permease subunit